MTRVWNPAIEAEGGGDAAYAEVDDSAVPHLRQSGWLLASEREGHEAAHAEHRQRAEAERAELDAAKAAEHKPRTGAKAGAADKTAGGSAGTEGS